MTATYVPFWDGTWVEPATAISFVGSAQNSGTDTTSIILTTPGATATGDLIIIAVAARGNGVIGGPATFTDEGGSQSGTGSADALLKVYSKYLTGAPAATYTVTDSGGTNRWAAGMLVYRGTDPSTPVAYQAGAAASGGVSVLPVNIPGGYPSPWDVDHWYVPLVAARANIQVGDQDIGVVTNRIVESGAATKLYMYDSNGGFNAPSPEHYTRLGVADRWASLQIFLKGAPAPGFTGWGIPI